MSRLPKAIYQHLHLTFEALAHHSPDGATEEFGPITAVSAGVPTGIFNRVFVFEPFEQADLMRAIEWFTSRGDPFWVSTLDSLHRLVEEAFGDIPHEKSDPPQPGMARPLPSDMPDTDTGAAIEAVTQDSGLDTWSSAAKSVFGFSDETTRRITPSSVLNDDKLQYFVGWVDDQPVTCGMLSIFDSVAAPYVIGVDEDFRRRGIGEAMMWEVLREGRQRGAEVSILQSTQMAIPLYEKMGFETEIEFRHFVSESWL